MSKYSKLIKNLGYEFKNQKLLIQALTHRSYDKINNERLEFLGDGLLNFIIASELFKKFPEATEGQLSRLRAHLVRSETLSEISKEKDVGGYLRLGQGEMKSGGCARGSILADAVEAIIAAIFLDAGYTKTYQRVSEWYRERLKRLNLKKVYKDPKSRLQELLQAQQMSLPEYKLVKTVGEEHNQKFIIQCKVELLKKAIKGEGTSRRRAEQEAAKNVLEELKNGS